MHKQYSIFEDKHIIRMKFMNFYKFLAQMISWIWNHISHTLKARLRQTVKKFYFLFHGDSKTEWVPSSYFSFSAAKAFCLWNNTVQPVSEKCATKRCCFVGKRRQVSGRKAEKHKISFLRKIIPFPISFSVMRLGIFVFISLSKI